MGALAYPGSRYRNRFRRLPTRASHCLDDHNSGGRLGTAVSNAVVSLFADYLGRGPTRARATLSRDLVTVVLEETLTKAERHLVSEGEAKSVIETRRVVQHTMRDGLVAVVERHTGCRVAAFLSDQSVEPDVSVEVFVLEPSGDLG